MKYITHYTKLDTLLNRILGENRLLFNNLKKTNDPYEYHHRPLIVLSDNGIDPEDWNRLDLTDSITDGFQEKNINVGCFVFEPESSRNDFSNFQSTINPPLWAHYGENQNGVAIVFDKDLIVAACKNRIHYKWAIHDCKIKYDLKSYNSNSDPSIIRLHDASNKNKIELAEEIFNKSKEFYFYKHPKWSYEDEYRIMIYYENIKQVHIDISNCIKAIVFGEKVSNFTINSLKPKCDELGIECLHIKFDGIKNKFTCKIA